MRVSIVIPCRNELKYIALCLDSIVAQDYPKDKLWVYVCDGQSDDGTIDIIKSYEAKYPYIKYLNNPHKTTPHALNLGLKQDGFDIAIILGAHAALAPDYVSKSVACFNIDPDIGCVGGIIENIHENEISEAIGLAMSSSFGVGNAHFRTATKDGYVDTVAFGAYKKEVFEKIGYFDESLVRNQDDEFNYRVIINGFKIWLSHDIKCVYYVRASFPKLLQQYKQYGYWKVFVNKKHKAVTTLRQLVPFVWVFYLIFAWLPALYFWPWIFLYLCGILLYLCVSLYAAWKLTKNLSTFLRVLRAFYTLHLGYGWGYFKGIVDFLILNKKPSSDSMKMSR